MTDEANVSDDPLRGSKILVVDDVAKNIQVLGSVLRQAGYQVIPATSGQQALKAAESHNPDLILLDVMMPEMSGHEVIQHLKKMPEVRDTPVIFVTALTDDEDEQKGLDLGAVDYITKPVKLPIALARVKAHLSLNLARRTLADQNQELIEAAQLREDVERITRHDLKSPLQVILAAPQLIQLQGNLDEMQTDMLQRIRNSGYRMLEMINRSLDLYKMETGAYQFEPEPVNLSVVMGKIFGELQQLASSSAIDLVLEIDGQTAAEDSEFLVMAEELLCHSLFSNVVKNAIEASPGGERITVSLTPGDPATVRVRNLGSVPEEIRETFFEKYVTSGKKTGTGLGTYSAKLITETMRGTIRLDSSEEGATAIEIALPTTGG